MLLGKKLSKITKTKRIQGPLMENLYLNSSNRLGNKLNSTFEPSKGGIGIRLKTIKMVLTKTNKNKKLVKRLYGPRAGATNFRIMPNIKIPKKFENGPAREITPSAKRGFLVLPKFTGTGLAQPKPTKTSIKNPNGSKCAKGFKVIRPACSAVLSPKKRAAAAWENS